MCDLGLPCDKCSSTHDRIIDASIQESLKLAGRVKYLSDLAKGMTTQDLNILFLLIALESNREYFIDCGEELEKDNAYVPPLDADGIGLPNVDMALEVMDDQVCAGEAKAVYKKIEQLLSIDIRRQFRFKRTVEKVKYEAI